MWALQQLTIKKEPMNARCVSASLITVAVLLIPQTFYAADANDGHFHFPVGFAYGSGLYKAYDRVFDYYEADPYFSDVSRINIPVGLVLNPYYEWGNGIGVGVTVGPTAFLAVYEKTDTWSYYGRDRSDEIKFSYAVPVGGFVRYTFWPKAKVAPYIKAGVKYPIAGGDNFGSSQVGGFGAVGVEFWRTKALGMSLEAGYDSSEIKVKYTRHDGSRSFSDKVTFPGFTVALSVTF
jgi:hypothetical protein